MRLAGSLDTECVNSYKHKYLLKKEWHFRWWGSKIWQGEIELFPPHQQHDFIPPPKKNRLTNYKCSKESSDTWFFYSYQSSLELWEEEYIRVHEITNFFRIIQPLSATFAQKNQHGKWVGYIILMKVKGPRYDPLEHEWHRRNWWPYTKPIDFSPVPY